MEIKLKQFNLFINYFYLWVLIRENKSALCYLQSMFIRKMTINDGTMIIRIIIIIRSILLKRDNKLFFIFATDVLKVLRHPVWYTYNNKNLK